MLARTDKKSDKRTDTRVASNAPIIFSLFSTRFWKEYPSITRNHSHSGMCFESTHPLRPGSNLFIRAAKQPDSESAVPLRSSTLAEVKWCRELADKHATAYRVGARYY
jgi:hypothetical protein